LGLNALLSILHQDERHHHVGKIQNNTLGLSRGIRSGLSILFGKKYMVTGMRKTVRGLSKRKRPEPRVPKNK